MTFLQIHPKYVSTSILHVFHLLFEDVTGGRIETVLMVDVLSAIYLSDESTVILHSPTTVAYCQWIEILHQNCISNVQLVISADWHNKKKTSEKLYKNRIYVCGDNKLFNLQQVLCQQLVRNRKKFDLGLHLLSNHIETKNSIRRQFYCAVAVSTKPTYHGLMGEMKNLRKLFPYWHGTKFASHPRRK